MMLFVRAIMPRSLKKNNKRDLTQGSIMAHLLRLSWPMIIAMFAIMSNYVADSYFVAQLGTEALAAVSFAGPTIFVILNILFGFSVATSSILSRKIGSLRKGDVINENQTADAVTNNAKEVRQYATHALILGLLVTSIVSGIAALFNEPMFRLMGVTDQLAPLVNEYMMMWYVGAPLVVLPVIGNAVLRASGDSLSPAFIMTLIAIVNFILDPILIFGRYGMPEMGVRGAALATVIAHGVGMGLSLYFLHHRDRIILWAVPNLKVFIKETREFLDIAIPAAANNVIFPLFVAVLTAMVARFGVEAVAALGVASRVESFSFVLWIALSIGSAPIIGQNYGRGYKDRVHTALKLALSIGFVSGIVCMVILGIFAVPIVTFFDSDPEVVKYGVLYFSVVPVSYAFVSIFRIYNTAFNVIGRARRALFLTCIHAFVLGIPVLLLSGWLYGLAGMFTALSVGYIVIGTAVWLWHRFVQPIETL